MLTLLILKLRADRVHQLLGEKHRMRTAKFRHYGDKIFDIKKVVIEKAYLRHLSQYLCISFFLKFIIPIVL